MSKDKCYQTACHCVDIWKKEIIQIKQNIIKNKSKELDSTDTTEKKFTPKLCDLQLVIIHNACIQTVTYCRCIQTQATCTSSLQMSRGLALTEASLFQHLERNSTLFHLHNVSTFCEHVQGRNDTIILQRFVFLVFVVWRAVNHIPAVFVICQHMHWILLRGDAIENERFVIPGV